MIQVKAEHICPRAIWCVCVLSWFIGPPCNPIPVCHVYIYICTHIYTIEDTSTLFQQGTKKRQYFLNEFNIMMIYNHWSASTLVLAHIGNRAGAGASTNSAANSSVAEPRPRPLGAAAARQPRAWAQYVLPQPGPALQCCFVLLTRG